MEQYIKKSALVAEIEKLVDKGKYHEEYDCAYRDGNNSALYALKGKIDTIEVKEVNLEKEYKDFVEEDPVYNKLVNGIVGKAIAKHFFELGMQASNPLTWEDMMTIHKCCKDAMNCNLYAWETAEGQQKIYEDVLKRFKELKNGTTSK